MSELKDQTVTLNVRLKPSEPSAHPRATNYTNIGVAQGIAYLDFGFIEPTLLAAVAKTAKVGRLAKRIGGYARRPRGDERGRADALASADSAGVNQYARRAAAQATIVSDGFWRAGDEASPRS